MIPMKIWKSRKTRIIFRHTCTYVSTKVGLSNLFDDVSKNLYFPLTIAFELIKMLISQSFNRHFDKLKTTESDLFEDDDLFYCIKHLFYGEF